LVRCNNGKGLKRFWEFNIISERLVFIVNHNGLGWWGRIAPFAQVIVRTKSGGRSIRLSQYPPPFIRSLTLGRRVSPSRVGNIKKAMGKDSG